MMRVFVAFSLFALVFQMEAYAYELTSGTQRIVFGNADDGYAIRHLVNTSEGNAQFLNADGRDDFWFIQFVRKGENGLEYTTLGNHSPANRSCKTKKGEIAFFWKDMALRDEWGVVDVTARVKADPKRNAAEWTLEVVCRSRNWALNWTRYPIFQEVLPEGEGDMLVPAANFGARLCQNTKEAKGKRLANIDWASPGWYPQMMAFWKTPSSGLYVCAEDPEARLKSLHLGPNCSIHFQTTVEGAGIVSAKPNGPKYKVVTAAFSGDWWKVAALYRDWALKAPWARKGPMASRADYPKRLAENHAWYRIQCVQDVQGIAPQCDAAYAQMPDVKLGFQWYSWNNEAFDTKYPHFSPKPGAAERIAEFKERGDLIMPYVNGRLWDLANEDYPVALKSCAALKIDGTPWPENYPTANFSIMCPGSRPWQNELVKVAGEMFGGLKVNALYVDQVCCASGVVCYNPAHGHPVGGGRWWMDGYREAFAKIRALAQAQSAGITTEGAGDMLMDVIDGYLVGGKPPLTREIPFYPAVYSGYTSYFGAEEHTGEDSFDAFFARQVSLFFWGVQSGRWISFRAAEQYELIRKLALARERYKDYLVYGSMIDELRTKKPQMQFTFEYAQTRQPGAPEKITYPAVVGYWWRNADKTKTALFAANISDVPQEVEAISPRGAPLTISLAPHKITVRPLDR